MYMPSNALSHRQRHVITKYPIACGAFAMPMRTLTAAKVRELAEPRNFWRRSANARFSPELQVGTQNPGRSSDGSHRATWRPGRAEAARWLGWHRGWAVVTRSSG